MKLNISISIGGVFKGSKQVTTPCMIGRSKEANLPVAHPVVSRKHCELFEKEGNLYLRDNSSLNGTIYKGGYVEHPIGLTTDDEFMVGELTFKITILESSASGKQEEIVNELPIAVSTEPINNATISNSSDSNSESDSKMVTILESPQSPQTLADENTPTKKNSQKISPNI
jgi:pSer/pThr/pTyr-binding forkhead associated (FHA) protein